jgi:hypothetical protein
MSRIALYVLVAQAAALPGWLVAGDWTSPVEVRHDTTLCLTYQAKWSGDYLLVRAKIEFPWHTFAMDNKQRADEKLAGKPSLGQDRPTSIKLSGGLELDGGWQQYEPKDFSKPELRWFSWGYEGFALFAAKVKRSGQGPAQIAIGGQACTESICKNIDVDIGLPVSGPAGANPAEIELKGLIPVRR